MLAIEVSLNGRRVCAAGLRAGAVSAIVATVNRPPRYQTRGRPRKARSANLTVSGYTETETAHEYPWWVPTGAIPRLRVGDSVVLRIVDVPRADRPRTRRRQAKRPLEYYERREYLRLKAKYAKKRGA